MLHKNNKKKKSLYNKYDFLRLVLLVVALSVVGTISAQERKPLTRSITTGAPPTGYERLGDTQLYYSRKLGHVYVGNISIGSIDLVGKFGENYYSSTYGDYGYVVAMQVDENEASYVDCLYGSNLNGVTFEANVEQQGELAKVYYTLTNTNEKDVIISLGVYDDVAVGNNISPNISRKIDTMGNAYGMSLVDTSGAQLCVLFGSGLAGVVGCDDFWFGSYSLNTSAYAIAGHYSTGYNYMVENGGYDCGIGWCWKDRVIPAGETVVFSYLIGVGDVNLEPSSTFAVTPDDPDGWNDLSLPHSLTLDGEYESPAGLEGRIEYAVEDEEEWHALTGMLKSGDTFSASLIANFDASKQKHVIRFRTVDNVGNTTMLPSIEYLDVSFYPVTGITDKTYTGEPLYQTDLACDLEADQFSMSRYINNVDAGTATFYVEGLFPYTIGRKAYTFTINPAPLAGGISLQEAEFVYNGEPFTPEWTFTESGYAALEKEKDYKVTYENNIEPGTGTVSVEGIGNYTGLLSQTFLIDKAPLTEAQYSFVLPDEDISYDEQPHGVTISTCEGMGEAVITYNVQGDETGFTDAPSAPGHYDIYLEIAEGAWYHGMEKTKIGSFSIYHFDDAEWAVLEKLNEQMAQQGWAQPWDMSQGAKAVSTFKGLTISQGHVVGFDLHSSNLSGSFPWDLFGLQQLEELDLSGNNLSGDIGTGMVAVKMASPTAATKLRNVNISGNKLSGNISLFANSCPALEYLDASDNCISDAAPTIPLSVTTLKIDGQTIDRTMDIDLSNLSIEALLATIPTVILYNHEAQTYDTSMELLCTTADPENFDMSGDDWGVIIKYADGRLTMPQVSKQNVYYGESGDVVNAMKVDGGHKLKIKLSFARGDANFDGSVDVTDLQTIILHIFDRYDVLPFNYTAANNVKDETINVQDVVEEVNLLMASGNAAETTVPVAKAATHGDGGTADADVYCNGNDLKIYTQMPVAALDIMVANASEATISGRLEALGMTYAVKETALGTHIICYSLTGGLIPAGETTIASFKGNGCSVVSATLSNEDASRLDVRINIKTTGIGSTEAGEPDAVINNGKLVVTAGSGNMSWTVSTADGKMLGKGSTRNGGTTITDINVNGMVIVTLETDGMKKVKKLTNNR